MCGIAGFIDLWDSREARDKQERAAILDRMCRIIQHRGPDDQGVTVKPGVALGMRRLAIIDLVSGNQPMCGEDGSVTIVFNGEIYNFQEIKPKLEAHGHIFQTHSDTEAIIHAYEDPPRLLDCHDHPARGVHVGGVRCGAESGQSSTA